MAELWALLHFLNPDLFNNLDKFKIWFDDLEDKDTLSKLHKVMKPFLLRRMKNDVLRDLKEKTEIVLYTGLSAMQKKYSPSSIYTNLCLDITSGF